MEFQKDIHFSPGLEAAILGASMIEKTAFGRTHGILKKEVFYSDANQTVYQAISDLYSAGYPVDILTVLDRVYKVMGVELLAGANVDWYLTSLEHAVVSSANIEYHSWIIRRMW